jgi:cell pole-organizing protein PopZ
MVREPLRLGLGRWPDKNLPPMVEKLVRSKSPGLSVQEGQTW